MCTRERVRVVEHRNPDTTVLTRLRGVCQVAPSTQTELVETGAYGPVRREMELV